MSELPADWRSRAQAMILGHAAIDGAMFRGGPWSTPAGQIQVYREQYLMRLGDVLAEDLIGTAAVLGEEYADTVAAYLHDHPPSTWTLARVIDALPGWLASRGAPAAQIEMATLDREVQVAFTSSSGRTPTPEELEGALAAGAPLRLQAHVRLLRNTTNVHLLRSDVTAGDPARAVEPGRYHLALFRTPDLRIRHLEMPAPAWAILRTFADGASVDLAVDAALNEVDGDAEQVAPHLQGWFRLFMERGLLELSVRNEVLA